MKSDLQSQSESLEQCFPVLNEHLLHLTKEFHEIQAPHEMVMEKLCPTCSSMMAHKLALYAPEPLVQIRNALDVLLNSMTRSEDSKVRIDTQGDQSGDMSYV